MEGNGIKRATGGQFLPGSAGGPGRPRGIPQKATVIRAAILESWDRVGGQAVIDGLARSDPVTWLRLVVGALPKYDPAVEAADDDGNPNGRVRSVVDAIRVLSDLRRGRIPGAREPGDPAAGGGDAQPDARMER